jgi:hypothetical protein
MVEASTRVGSISGSAAGFGKSGDSDKAVAAISGGATALMGGTDSAGDGNGMVLPASPEADAVCSEESIAEDAAAGRVSVSVTAGGESGSVGWAFAPDMHVPSKSGIDKTLIAK